MLIAVIVLIVTNVVTLGALAYVALRPPDPRRPVAPDAVVAGALDTTPRPAGAVGPERRLISIEILNPIELAGTRGRLIGLAGSLVPGLTRRIVYDQTLRILKQQLTDQHVVADVRLHKVRPVRPRPDPGTPADGPDPVDTRVTVVQDESEPVDLTRIETTDGDQAT